MTSPTDTAPAFRGGNPDTSTTPPRMARAAWRQHRAWVIGTVALVLTGGLVLAVIVWSVPACTSTSWTGDPGAACSAEPAQTLWRLYQVALSVLPVLAGAVLGAVTFGSDKDNRTHVYALTQGVTRIRWWATKVVLVAGPVVVAAALLGMATLWVVNASDTFVISTARTTSPNFDSLGLIPATRFLVAYAAAAAAALLWRTVGGLVTGVAIAGVVVAGTSLLQPMVVSHTRELVPVQAWWDDATGLLGRGDLNSTYNWSGYADAQGADIDPSTLKCADADFVGCLQDAGVAYRVETYVSDARYPQMMLVISGLNLLIAGALLGGGATLLRRRDL